MTTPVKINTVKGFRDVLPDEAEIRQEIVARSVSVLGAYNYREIELPLIEKGDLFVRTVGATSDIVEKEMYAFEDRDGALIALRPEGTASVVRAFVEAGLPRANPTARLYYVGPMFRRERPQKGRYRQFSQIGAELFGRDDAVADAETLCLVDDICKAAEVKGHSIELNSLGDEKCRPAYRDALRAFGKSRIDALCEDCRGRLDRNPLRLLDCKNERCRDATNDAPLMLDHLCDDCGTHHEAVLALLKAADVAVAINARMVRGLDYYCRTAFEIIGEGLGAQGAVGGGGRYDGLVAELGGGPVPGIGFAFGIERMVLASALAEQKTERRGIFIAPLDRNAEVPAFQIARRLRAEGWRVENGVAGKKLKALLQKADKAGARHVVILGEDEIADGFATVRDLERHEDVKKCFALDAGGSDMVEAIAALDR